MDKTAIIVQGPTSHLDVQKRVWYGHNVIYSTWKGEEHKYAFGGPVIFNDPPEEIGIQNLGYQQKSTLEGLKLAKSMGYERAIKIRSDMVPESSDKFIKLFTQTLNFFFWHDWDGGYFIDYFMGGDIDVMIDLWTFPNPIGWYRFPEQAITNTFFYKEMNKLDYRFIGREITEDSNIYWMKNAITLANYNNDPLFKTEIPYV